jgi:type I restriction enzyme S subunit
VKAVAWETALLREVTTKIGTGATPRGGSDSYKATGVPLIRSLNIYDDGFREEGLAYLDAEQANRLDHVIVQKGDVLLNITGASVARCCVAPEQHLPARVNQHVSIIRPRPDVLCHRFLHYLLIAGDCKKRLLDTGEGGGTTRQAITKAQLQDFRISFPPLPEQRRIVAILDEAFEGITAAKANAEKNLGNASELFESIVASAVTPPSPKWRDTVLGTLAVVDWGNTDLTKNAYVDAGKYLAVSAAGCDGRIGHSEHKAFTPVLSAIGAQCGKMFMPEEDFTAIKNTITLTPNPHLCDSWFLFYLLGAKTLPKRGAAQPFIAKGDVLGFSVAVPSVEDQRTIAARLRELQPSTVDLNTKVSAKLAALDELKASLLHQAFTGAL